MSNWLKKNWLAVVPFIVIFGIFTIFSSLQWSSVMSNSPDLGIFTQTIMKYANFQVPYNDIKNMLIFGDHFSPILILAVPFYWLIPSGLGVMICENFLFALTSSILFIACKKRFSNIPSLLISIAFGMSFEIQFAVVTQFHEVCFGVLIIAISLLLYQKKNYTISAIVMALLVFVKEDFGSISFVFGLIIAYSAFRQNDKKNIITGIFVSVWSFVITTIAIFVIIPSFNIKQSNLYIDSLFVNLGGADVIPQLLQLLFLLLISGGFIWASSPLGLMMIPELLVRFATSGVRASNTQYFWQYDAINGIIIFFALIEVMPKFFKLLGLGNAKKSELPKRRFYFSTAIGTLVLIVSITTSFITPMFRTPLNALLDQSPSDQQIHFDWSTSQVAQDTKSFETGRLDKLNEVINSLKSDLSKNPTRTNVAVDRNPLAYLVNPAWSTFFFPMDPIDRTQSTNCVSPNYDNCYYTWPKGLKPDYYIVSSYGVWASNNPGVVQIAKQYYPDETYEVVYQNDTYQLAKRTSGYSDSTSTK